VASGQGFTRTPTVHVRSRDNLLTSRRYYAVPMAFDKGDALSQARLCWEPIIRSIFAWRLAQRRQLRNHYGRRAIHFAVRARVRERSRCPLQSWLAATPQTTKPRNTSGRPLSSVSCRLDRGVSASIAKSC